ncbi:MAG: histidine phosphatase family protein [Alphaproteobacteria bacterium]|nr:histidine phosphatase family protein [Alphaproteobacteria bacterium]
MLRLHNLAIVFTTLAFTALTFAPPASAAMLSGARLADALKGGGYVLVMRHASSPTTPPASPDPGNMAHERQLDDRGKAAARAMGDALHAMRITIGKIYSSPTFRARQTVALLEVGKPEAVPDLGDGGHSMARIQKKGPADWLRAHAAEAPAPGHDTLIVTHMPNIVAAFPTDAPGMGDGEALVFHPDGKGGATLMARVPISEWPALAR